MTTPFVTFTCRQCGTTVARSRERAGRAAFCSRRCSARWQAAQPKRSAKIAVTCTQCGLVFDRWPYDTGRRFCSRRCKTAYGRDHPPTMSTYAARFWPKVDKTGDCWTWTGARTPTGYSVFHWSDGANGHRFAYVLLRGPIPPAMTVDHLCTNTSCVNPAHMELVTASENLRRRHARH